MHPSRDLEPIHRISHTPPLPAINVSFFGGPSWKNHRLEISSRLSSCHPYFLPHAVSAHLVFKFPAVIQMTPSGNLAPLSRARMRGDAKIQESHFHGVAGSEVDPSLIALSESRIYFLYPVIYLPRFSNSGYPHFCGRGEFWITTITESYGLTFDGRPTNETRKVTDSWHPFAGHSENQV